MSNKKIDALFKASDELHENAPKAIKKRSLIECGVTDPVIIEWLLKMKHGAFSKVKLALDSAEVSDCIFTFRLLTAAEDDEIENEMAATGLSYIDSRYKRKYIALVLSKASTPHPSMKEATKEFNSPELPFDALYKIPSEMLYAVGYHYEAFRKRCSPKLESLTQEQIDDCIERLEKCEDDIKKFDLLNGWNLNATHEVIIDLVKKLGKLTKQMEAALIG
jgi:hypothetical protein